MVLPAPLSPSTSTRSPRPTSNVTSSNTVLAPNALAEIDDFERDPSRVRRIGQPHPRILRPCEPDATRASQLVDPLVERLGDAGPLLGLVAHRVGERRQARISLSWRVASLARRCSSASRAAQVLRIGAAVFDELALVEVQHPRDRLVEQLDVVADHEQRAPVGAQEAASATAWRRRRGGSWARRA